MLVLERRSGESILIYPSDQLDPDMTVGELFRHHPIRVSIKSRDKGAFKIAISAPDEMKILREELKPRR